VKKQYRLKSRNFLICCWQLAFGKLTTRRKGRRKTKRHSMSSCTKFSRTIRKKYMGINKSTWAKNILLVGCHSCLINFMLQTASFIYTCKLLHMIRQIKKQQFVSFRIVPTVYLCPCTFVRELSPVTFARVLLFANFHMQTSPMYFCS